MKSFLILICLIMLHSHSIARDTNGSMIISVAAIANDTLEDYEEDDLNYGAAILVEAGFNDHFGIETGVLYTKIATAVDIGNFTFGRETNRLHIPILAKFWVSDFFALGAGPFATFRTGSIENKFSNNGNTVNSVETSADNDVRFGLDLSATLNFAVADKTGLFVELRHSSFFDDDNSESSDQLFGLVGLKFDI